MKKLISSPKNYYLIFCLLFLSMIHQTVFSQDEGKNIFYLLKKDGHAAKDLDKAAYFMQVTAQNDTTYICRYYQINGPMMRQEVFFDSGLTIPNGRFCWYDAKGNLDSSGLVYRGKKDWIWNYYDDMLNPVTAIMYDKGRFVERRNAKRNSFINDSLAQSTPATFKSSIVDEGRQDYIKKNITIPDRFLKVLERNNYESVISFCLNKEGGIQDIFLLKSCEWSADAEVFKVTQKSPQWKPAIANGVAVDYNQIQSIVFQTFYPSDESVTDSALTANNTDAEKVFIKVKQVEAQFPGGEQKWKNYLAQNANCSIALQNGAPVGLYTVTVSFVVDKKGNVTEVKALNDPGYGIAEEAIRVFKKSPRWIAAVQYGKNVNYRQKQNMTFSVYEK